MYAGRIGGGQYADYGRKPKHAAKAAPVDEPMTEAQERFIRKLLAEKDIAGTKYGDVVATDRMDAVLSILTKAAASNTINDLMQLRRKVTEEQKAATSVVLESGIYLSDGKVFKVYKAVHGSGQMCAKELVADEETQTASFEYRGLAVRFVKADQRMTLAQAKEFGAIYGVCCNCGRMLTDETSIEAGIGPICASRF